MPGVGSFQRDFDRFAIAHFAHQNNFRRLPQRGPQGQRECGRVAVKFALMYGGLFVIVAKLDGVFDAQDVDVSFVVGPVDDSRQGGCFPRAGRPRDEHNAIVQMNDLGESRRKVQIFEAGNIVGNHAHDDGVSSTLPENVDAKSADCRDGIGKVGRALLFQSLSGIRLRANQIIGDLQGVLRREALESLKFQFHKLAAGLDLWRVARRENQVADVFAAFQHRGDEWRSRYGGRGGVWFRWGVHQGPRGGFFKWNKGEEKELKRKTAYQYL